MPSKLNGMLVLSDIPKELIGENKKGKKVIYVDIVENRNGADQYGNTHSIQLYNKNTRQVVYLGNLKPVSFGHGSSQSPNSDLGF